MKQEKNSLEFDLFSIFYIQESFTQQPQLISVVINNTHSIPYTYTFTFITNKNKIREGDKGPKNMFF